VVEREALAERYNAGMGDSELVVVHTFKSRPEADLAQSALEAAGIESTVLADDAGGTQPGFWEGEPVRVLVRAEDEREAREILDTAAKPAPDSD
jgi:Putative prokaryotic signal transducing protein